MDEHEESAVEAVVCSEENSVPLPGDKQELADKTTIFLCYLQFFGDAEKVAAALDLDVKVVQDCAEEEGWYRKVEALKKLRADKGADALAKELNRTANYIQAVRIRRILDRVIRNVCRSKVSFDDFITAHGKNASNTSLKAPLELVKAVEACHRLTYCALGDTLTERVNEASEVPNNVSLSVLRALTAGAADAGPSDPVAGARQQIIDLK